MSHRVLHNASAQHVDLRSPRGRDLDRAHAARSGQAPTRGKRPMHVRLGHKCVVPVSSSAIPVASLNSVLVSKAAAAALVVIVVCYPQPLLAAQIEPEISQITPSSWAAGFQQALSRLFQGSGNAPAPGLGAAKRAEQYSGPASTTNSIAVPPLSKLLNEVAEPFPGRKSVISKEAKKAKKSEDQDRARELALDSDDNVERASRAALDKSVLLNAARKD